MKYAAVSAALGLTLAAGSVTYAQAPNHSEPTQHDQAAAPAHLEGLEGLTGENLVANGDFEAGEVGWAVTAPHAQVSVDRSGRGGSAGLVVQATQDTEVRAAYTIEDALLAPGSRVDAVVWVRATTVPQAVRLTLDELQGDGGWQPVYEIVRSATRGWEPIRTTAVVEEIGSALQVRVDLKRLPAGATIRLDDVWVSRDTRPTALTAPGSRRLNNGCAISQRGVPVCSAYFGAAYKLNTDPTAWEASLGRPLGVRRTYYAADQVDTAVERVRGDLAAGRLPWISFKLPYSWADMAAGRGDGWALDLSRRLAQVPGPVWVAFHHEPEGDGDVREWTAMQQRLAPLVRSTAPNVGYTIILTGWNQFYGEEQYHLESIWPKGTKVDVAGFDVYNYQGVNRDGKVETETTPIAQRYFAPLSRWAREQGVAWAVAETGYTHTAAEQDPEWLYRTYQELLQHGGVAFTYFNSTANSIAPWDISTPEKQRQFEYALRHSPRL